MDGLINIVTKCPQYSTAMDHLDDIIYEEWNKTGSTIRFSSYATKVIDEHVDGYVSGSMTFDSVETICSIAFKSEEHKLLFLLRYS